MRVLAVGFSASEKPGAELQTCCPAVFGSSVPSYQVASLFWGAKLDGDRADVRSFTFHQRPKSTEPAANER